MKKTLSLLLLLALAAPAKKFYSDDPLQKEPTPIHVKDALTRKLSDIFDLFYHQFGKPGERQPEKGTPVPAKGINTLGEPMDGAWWERRHYYKRMSQEELLAGPGNTNFPPPDEKWTVVNAKNEGVTPGFTVLDSKKRRFFIKFDPIPNPEMASFCDAVVSRLFYAMGFHVPENNIVYFKPDQLVLADNITLADATGTERKMQRRDLLEILLKVPKTKDGRYRATSSFALPGKPIGPPRYFGTRADDPNDTIPHEHRRELRGLQIAAAWLGHDDSRAINNIDILYKQGDLQYVRHYLLDFGSTLGSGTEVPNSARSGSPFFAWKASAKQLFTLGLVPPYWAFAKFPNYPSVGRFESKVFDPEKWVPEYPNPAFLNRLPDDEFWGAKLVTSFTDQDLQTIVKAGQMSNPAALDWVLKCLRERRDKIGKAYFSKLLPLDQFTVENGQLNWVDLGAKLNLIPAATVTQQWFSFDNETEKKTSLPGQTGRSLPNREGYIGVSITSTQNPKHSIDVFLFNGRVVGIDRKW
jgi:hypothetical protein